MITDIFGKPERYGVELTPRQRPEKREVHVTGYVVVEYHIDEWIEADEDETDEDIKRAALEEAAIPGGDIESHHLSIDDEKRKERRDQRRRERDLLDAWNRGEPIQGGS
jgi:hypothetical protein